VVLEGNTAPGSGGALGLQADTTATFGLWNGDVTFLENSATDHGGAIFAESDGSVDSPVILTAADAYELNAAGGDGGAVALFDEASIELSDGGTFTTNAAIGNGGAIAAHDNAELVLPHGRVVATTNRTSSSSSATSRPTTEAACTSSGRRSSSPTAAGTTRTTRPAAAASRWTPTGSAASPP
jgi:predicted outer membrane repeat protein